MEKIVEKLVGFIRDTFGRLLTNKSGEMDLAARIILAFIISAIAIYILQLCSIN